MIKYQTVNHVLMLYSHITNMLIYICIYMQNNSQRLNDKGRAKTSLTKYVPLTLLLGFEKVFQGFMVWGSWRPNRTAIHWPPLLWPSALCLSRFPGLLNRRPRGSAFCWMMAFFTASYHQLLWTPTQSGAPSPIGLVWLPLPHLVSYSNCLTSCLDWLI